MAKGCRIGKSTDAGPGPRNIEICDDKPAAKRDEPTSAPSGKNSEKASAQSFEARYTKCRAKVEANIPLINGHRNDLRLNRPDLLSAIEACARSGG